MQTHPPLVFSSSLALHHMRVALIHHSQFFHAVSLFIIHHCHCRLFFFHFLWGTSLVSSCWFSLQVSFSLRLSISTLSTSMSRFSFSSLSLFGAEAFFLLLFHSFKSNHCLFSAPRVSLLPLPSSFTPIFFIHPFMPLHSRHPYLVLRLV